MREAREASVMCVFNKSEHIKILVNKFTKIEHINTSMNIESIMVRNIFAGKSSMIIRVLLSKPSKTWRTRDLASEAHVSLGLVSIVTNRLIDMGFLVRDRTLRLRLRKEEELLRRLASFYDLNEWAHRTYYARGKLYEIGTRLVASAEGKGLKYAFTGPFATDLLTQYIRSAEIHTYVTNEDAIREIVNAMNLEIAEIGGNIIFLIPDDDSVFYGLRRITDSRVGEVTIVSDVQLILDLFNYTDRTREAAERLLAKEYVRKSEHMRLVRLAKEYFERKGLISAEPLGIDLDPRPDFVFLDPKTDTYVVGECKNSIAKLETVDHLKRIVSVLRARGSRGMGVLIAPTITSAAMKELSKAGLEFEPIERVEYGLHKRRS
jgi:hypothetical protein